MISFQKTYFYHCRTEIEEHLTPSQAYQKLGLRWPSLCTNILPGKVRIDGIKIWYVQGPKSGDFYSDNKEEYDPWFNENFWKLTVNYLL